MRIVVSALAICAASFLAGVAGDLSASAFQEPPARPQIVQLPPMALPPVDLTNAVRAHPLPTRTAAAAAAEPVAPARVAVPRRVLQPASLVEVPADLYVKSPFDLAPVAFESPAALKRVAAKPSPVFAGKTGEDHAIKV